MDIVALIRPVEAAIIDPFYVVDAERRIVHFNRAFFAMLPRSISRGLKQKKCHEVLEYDLPGDGSCVVEHCWKARKHVRLDEIQAQVARSDKHLTLILSALPFFTSDGTPSGALVTQRNVTDEAQVQTKYQEMLDTARREQDQLKEVIRQRTRALLDRNKELVAARQELMAFKRGRIV